MVVAEEVVSICIQFDHMSRLVCVSGRFIRANVFEGLCAKSGDVLVEVFGTNMI